ncbi:hypothetical protein [Actinacidiphila glaucinigra]|uniref:hypothetical protein n=1 Tax=Actinacidiphila glaucinigra TaxID=235986 RepID=UPI002E36A7C2|nr:hypothetical protein [Actinacidiphila glaucinigra]
MRRPARWRPLPQTRAGSDGAGFLRGGAGFPRGGAVGGEGDGEWRLTRVTAGCEVAGPDERIDVEPDFVAAARRDVPRLVAEVRRLRAALAAENS